LNDSYRVLTANELAQIVKSDPSYKGGTVTIGACRVGQNAKYVQDFANAIGACARAPVGRAWYGIGTKLYSADYDEEKLKKGIKRPNREKGSEWVEKCPSK